MMGSKSRVEGRFKEIKVHIERCSQNEVQQTIKMGLSGVEVAPFGPKLCQNVAPRLRIIFQALLGPKTKLKKTKFPEMLKIQIFTVQSLPLYIETPDIHMHSN